MDATHPLGLLHLVDPPARSPAAADLPAADRLLGASAPLDALKARIARAAQCNLTVCIEGETGTGKDLIARAIHESSSRRDRAFVARNCSAIPDALLESELFGHVRGAFTDARHDRKGLFELADGGTIFLDEIATASTAFQLRLLRALEDRVIVPLGGSKPRRIDVRVLCATNITLADLVGQGRFREDLFYRLHIFAIRVPPLRERPGDIALLARAFVAAIAAELGRPVDGIAPCAIEMLVQHCFPGNVRELKNEIEAAVANLEEGERVVRAVHFSDRLRGRVRPGSAVGAADTLPVLPGTNGGRLKDQLSRHEVNIIKQELASRRGNVTQTARSLGLTRRALVRKITKLGLRGAEPSGTGLGVVAAPGEIGLGTHP